MNDGVIWVFGGKRRVFLKNPRIHEKLEEYEVNFKGFPDNLPAGTISMKVPTLDGMVETDIITIDEAAVQNDVLELIKNIR